MMPDTTTPLAGENEEAKRKPNGWVYRIAGRFESHENVPPEAIIGAWKVDASGRIVGSFIANKNYNPDRWPPVLDPLSELPDDGRLR